LAYCDDSGAIGGMNNCQEKPNHSEETCPTAVLSTSNPTWLYPGSNPGCRWGKPAINSLSYGTAFVKKGFLILVLESNPVPRKLSSSGMWRFVDLVRTDVSEEHIASIIMWVTRFSEQVTTLTVTTNWSTLRRNTYSFHIDIGVFIGSELQLLVTSNVVLARWLFSPWWWRRHVPPKYSFLQEPYGTTFQKTAFFIVTAVENLKFYKSCNSSLCFLRYLVTFFWYDQRLLVVLRQWGLD
jgi:hypothetical protein